MALRPKVDRRVTDPTEFDLAVVRGALVLHNEFHSDDRKVQGGNVGDMAQLAFGWLPEVMRQRAERDHLGPATVRWHNEGSVSDLAAAASALLFIIGQFRLKPGQSIGHFGQQLTRESWYTEIVESLKPICGWRVFGDQTRFVMLPPLTGVLQCIAYAIAVVEMRGLKDLIRPCEFLAKPFEGSLAHHYFLADDPRQKFCSRRHANAAAQREWRRTNAAPRKHK